MELLHDKERRILESLFKLGQSTVNQISKDTLLNRTALYHTIDSLSQKGLITRIVKNKVSYYEAISLDQFEKWTQTKINSMTQTAKSDIERFASVRTDKKISFYTDVKYFEGFDGIKNLLADTIYNNKEKLIYAITDYERGYDIMGDWFEKEYFPERIRLGVRVKSLVPDSKRNRSYMATAKKLLREMCFVDIFKDLSIEISVYDDKIYFLAFDEKYPLGIIIKNEIITNAIRQIFNYIWKTGDAGSITNTP